MKSCKNCEWAGYCTFDDNAVICERDGSEYIPAEKVQETAEKCAEIFHCGTNEIPAALPKYRGSRQGYLYKLSEIYNFIEERRIPKKQ